MPILDLELALRRIENDFKYGRTFCEHPFQLKLVARERTKWLEALKKSVSGGKWAPSSAYVADAPKGGGAVRPAHLLTLEDQVVYTALVGSAISHLKPVLEWAIPPKDYGIELYKPDELEWVSLPVRSWKRFGERSSSLLKGAKVVVVTDITGFYEHIDHKMLISDLKKAGVPDEVVSMLRAGLGRWAVINGRGLPQNLTASHILSKIYLTIVDQSLDNKGRTHIRYRDDTRIFCQTTAEGKAALQDAIRSLRSRGLSLQSAKTKFLPPLKAKDLFDGTQVILRPLAKKYVKDIKEQLGVEDYMSVVEAEQHVAKGDAVIPTKMLRAAYEEHFLKGDGTFDRTLFHFLINRLGKAADGFATEHVVTLLEPKPEETEHILRYLARIGAVAETEAQLLDYFESTEALYTYQVFQFLDWRRRQTAPPSQRLLALARKWAAPSSGPAYVRSAARALLGRFGNDADLDDLMDGYTSASSDLEKAEIVCSTARMEVAKRNAFYGRLKGDGFLTDTAISAIKGGVDVFV